MVHAAAVSETPHISLHIRTKVLSAISSTGIGLRATLSLHLLFNMVHLMSAGGVTCCSAGKRVIGCSRDFWTLKKKGTAVKTLEMLVIAGGAFLSTTQNVVKKASGAERGSFSFSLYVFFTLQPVQLGLRF